MYHGQMDSFFKENWVFVFFNRKASRIQIFLFDPIEGFRGVSFLLEIVFRFLKYLNC